VSSPKRAAANPITITKTARSVSADDPIFIPIIAVLSPITALKISKTLAGCKSEYVVDCRTDIREFQEFMSALRDIRETPTLKTELSKTALHR